MEIFPTKFCVLLKAPCAVLTSMDGEVELSEPSSPELGHTKVRPPQPKNEGPHPCAAPLPLEEGWSCQTCTFRNAPALESCEMCETAKPPMTKKAQNSLSSLPKPDTKIQSVGSFEDMAPSPLKFPDSSQSQQSQPTFSSATGSFPPMKFGSQAGSGGPAMR